jgi:phosphoglucomutase/phosphomannomutase
MDSLASARAGFATVDADAALKDKALHNLSAWLTEPEFALYKPQIERLIALGKWSVLLDSFYQIMPFGTGGRRGSVGIGPNRMNLWTLGASVQGHCEYLKQKFPGAKELHVVLAYDVRSFADNRKQYDPALTNPVLGLTSGNFCEYAAGVYAANGIHSHILAPDAKRYVSTPELSFSIRHLTAHGGLNMTASHNPPDDNGSKFYDERGAQPVPPEDQLMSDLVDQVTTIRTMAWPEAVKSGKVHYLDETPHKAYIAMCAKTALIPPPRADEIRVVYTPLHGVGAGCAGETLLATGYKYIPVAEQMEPNGQFPNVTKSPNPEVPESLDRGRATAEANQADIVIATDPDADRIGGLACTSADGKGSYRFITGQEIATLLTYFKLSRLAAQGDLPASPIVVTTEVTTGRITRISRHFNAQIVNDLLVGFKYHAEVLRQLESQGHYGEVQGTIQDFVIATEESHGILATPNLRDKDSACAALLMAELALFLKRQKRTIPELLDDLARQFGYYRNELLNIVMPGIEGKTNIAKMLETLRKQPPKSIGGLTVTSVEDLQDENGKMGPFKGDTDKAARNFLIFRLNGPSVDAKVCLRPSGTEPKAKAYIEVCSAPRPAGTSEVLWGTTMTQIDGLVQKVATDFLTMALGSVGQVPAAGADKLSR